MFGFKPRYLNYRHAAACMALALATVALAAGAPVAQAQTVTVNNCANPILDAAGQPFGCLLSELIDANGGSIEVEPAITPAVKIEFVFDQNSFRPHSAGVTDTDPAEIGVIPVALRTNRPGLQFIDNNDEWKVQGGPDPDPNSFQSKSKGDVIEYVVVARNPQTNLPVARIKDAEVALQPGAVTSNAPNAPARAAVRDIVSDFDIATNTKLGSLTPGGVEVFKSTDKGEDLEKTHTFDPPQDAVHFLKEVKVEPGSDPNRMAEIENIRQHVSLTADKEVGCAPGAIEPAGGGQTPVEFCQLPQDQGVPFTGGVIAHDLSPNPAIGSGFGFGIGNFDPLAGSDVDWHTLGPADGGTTRIDHFTNLGRVFQPNMPGNTVNPNGADSNGRLLAIATAEVEPVFFGVVDAVLYLIDLNTGQLAELARLGDSVTVSLGTFGIIGLGNPRVTNTGIVMVDVEIERPGDPRTRPAVLAYDASGIFDTGAKPLVDSFVPGDTINTDLGFVTLGEFINLAAVDSATGAFAIRSVDFTTGEGSLLLFAPGALPRLVAALGDPLGGGLEIGLLPTFASLNGAGDMAATVTSQDPSAPFPSTTRRPLAALFPANGGIVEIIGRGDLLPIDLGAAGTPFIAPLTTRAIGDVAINNDGNGALEIIFLDANGMIGSAILGFAYDTGIVTFDSAPLIQNMDTVTADDGTMHVVGPSSNDMVINPQSMGNSAPHITVTFTDGTRAVLSAPVNAATPAVPDLIDLDQAQAEANIFADGFTLGTVSTQNSDTVPAGAVIAQDPPPGAAAAPGSAVDLVVSSGPVVSNVPPAVDAVPDATIDEGDTFVGVGSFSDPDADTWTATVDYGDGSGVQSLPLNPDMTFVLTHTYADDGVFGVIVTVTDDRGGVGIDTATVTVNNVAPTLDAGPDAAIDQGDTFLGAGSFSDPGADTWTATVDYGDGSGVQSLPLDPDNSFALDHSYAKDGAFTVTVTVTDDDGGVGVDTATVNVAPVAVTGDIDGDGDVDLADIAAILAALGQPASGPDDRRDLDGDGIITVLDVRKAVLECSRPRCATS